MKVFYWIDSKFGYAVSGGIARNALVGVVHAVAALLTKTTKVKSHGYVAA
jgi:anti-sigma factor RsiW